MLIYCRGKQRTAHCNGLYIKELYLRDRCNIITTEVPKYGFIDRGACIGSAVASEELGVIARYETREDAEEALISASRQAAKGELVVFDDDFYLIPYPSNEYEYAE